MRALAWFWIVVLLVVVGSVGTLAWLGPPPRLISPLSPRPGPVAAARPATQPAPVAGTPRVGILVAGIGMIAADSEAAIRTLPAAVSLAVSPYAPDPAATAAAARAAHHEVVLSLPMQPGAGATADAGDEALKPGQKASVSAQRLAWALARVPHPDGTTSLLGRGLDGAAFVASPALVGLTDSLAARHLWFLDARQVVLLDAPGTTLSHGLAALIARARRQGSAIGAIGAPSPDLVTALARLLPRLEGQGVRLVPVGAIMTKPEQ